MLSFCGCYLFVNLVGTFWILRGFFCVFVGLFFSYICGLLVCCMKIVVVFVCLHVLLNGSCFSSSYAFFIWCFPSLCGYFGLGFLGFLVWCVSVLCGFEFGVEVCGSLYILFVGCWCWVEARLLLNGILNWSFWRTLDTLCYFVRTTIVLGFLL